MKGGGKDGGAPEVVLGSPIIVDPGLLVLSTNFGRTLTMDDVCTPGCPTCTPCCPTCSLAVATGDIRGVEPPIAPSTSEWVETVCVTCLEIDAETEAGVADGMEGGGGASSSAPLRATIRRSWK